MGSLDYEKAKAFIAAIPAGCWSAYKDVAAASGNVKAAQAIGTWLGLHGADVPLDYRVLTVDGYVSDGFRGAGFGAPSDARRVRARLAAEGVNIDAHGRANQDQRFRAERWTGATLPTKRAAPR